MKSNGRWLALVIFALLALSAVYFYDALSGTLLFTERDLSVFFIPPRFLWVELIKGSTIPLWNPYYLDGHPLLANLHSGVFYPINIFYFILPFDLAFNYIIVAHYFLAGFFTFLLLRNLKASYCASLISAVTFMLSGYLLSVHNLLTHLLSVAWLPLVLLLFILGLRKESLRFIVYSGLAASVMFLGGGVEIVYVTIVVVCFIAFFQKDLFLPRKAGYIGVFIAIFLGVSAIQLLPFMELSAHSIRAGGISYKEATVWSLNPWDLLQFFLPDLYGYKLQPGKYWSVQSWLKTIYLGTIPFLLTLFFFIKRDIRLLYAFLLVIAGSLILAFGGHTPIYFYLYKYVPYFNKIRYPAKFLFLTTMVISVTAGLGYDRLRDGINEKSPAVRRLVYGIFVFGFITAIGFGYLNIFESGITGYLKSKGLGTPNYNELSVNMHNLKRLLCITTIFGLIIFVGLKRHATKKFLPSLIVILLAFDLFFAGQGFYYTSLSKSYHGSSANMDFIKSDKSLFRIFTTPKTMKDSSVVLSAAKARETDIINVKLEKISPGLNIERHIFDMWGSEVMIIKRIQNLYNLITSAPNAYSTNLLNLMNVKYVISMPQIESDELKLVTMNVPTTEEQMEELEKTDTIKVYQNLNCLPRAFLVKDYKVISSEEEYKNIMQSKEFNPAELLLLDEPPRISHPFVILSPPEAAEESQRNEKNIEKVEIVQYNNNSIHLQAILSEPKFLFMSESYYPGWKAYVDGERAHIYRANYAFRALHLGPGKHKVDFIYDPWTFKVGLIITTITICTMGFLLFRFK